MSQLEREEEGKKRRTKKGVVKPNTKGSLVNWLPNKDDRANLQAWGTDLEKVWDVLEARLEEGHRLSVGYNVDRAGWFAILREQTQDWQAAVSVSFWASTMPRTLVMVAYYLTHVNPDFPEGVNLTFNDLW